jgi:DNA-binding NtrC family response regulator
MPTVEPDAMAALTAYDWPGNVRELRNAIERALVVAQRNRIELLDLPEKIQASAASSASEWAGAQERSTLAPPPPAPSWPGAAQAPSWPGAPQGPQTPPPPPASWPGAVPAPPAAPAAPRGEVDLRAEMLAHERRLLVEVLTACDWNKTKAAQRLGLPLRTLTYKMTTLGIQRPER